MQCDDMEIGMFVRFGGIGDTGRVSSINCVRTPPLCRIVPCGGGAPILLDPAICQRTSITNMMCPFCGVDINPTTGNDLLDAAFETMRQISYNTCDGMQRNNLYRHETFNAVSKWMHGVVKQHPHMKIRIPLEIVHHDNPETRCTELLRWPEYDTIPNMNTWIERARALLKLQHNVQTCGRVRDAVRWVRKNGM